MMVKSAPAPDTKNPYHLDTGEVWVEPEKLKRRRQHFIRLPLTWYERLKGAHGQTYRVALYVLYLHWKDGKGPIKLANGMLKIDGVSPQSKRRALRDLERRKLVTVDWRPKKSPLVQLLV
jgi:hypothetical protein